MSTKGTGKTVNVRFLEKPCPECGDDAGPLTLLEERFDDGSTVRYRCHTNGHLTSAPLLTDQGPNNTVFGL